MATINPYLNFNGNTEEAFLFYKSVFGGEFELLQRYKEVPEMGTNLKEDDKEKIMHVSLPIGQNAILMGTDVLEAYGQTLTEGNNFSVAIGTDSEAEADKLFNGLSEGGTITMPLQKTFWGGYFGMFNDKFGIQWMVNYDHK
ncbi:VOC family protein [Cytophagaceae bacterium DM2B3-1]|uniref:VOC family protein n=1 Tax=Xanthocytophaga flava TaxID=3048013 RepID=A0ABT7CDN6_9BACT|nr:VOC family protein [Xanthocytophaga flavus]MDJ1470541.1 VOC family protein [Xanthocytophaga flavus]MDJ1491616.1 VOC family protein [Xanthocytophaga flavus]